MSQLLNSLLQIENSADKIMQEADLKKNEIEQKIKQKTIDFDKSLKKSTDDKIKQLADSFEDDITQAQTKLRSKTDRALIRMNAYYEANHTLLAEKILSKIIEV